MTTVVLTPNPRTDPGHESEPCSFEQSSARTTAVSAGAAHVGHRHLTRADQSDSQHSHRQCRVSTIGSALQAGRIGVRIC